MGLGWIDRVGFGLREGAGREGAAKGVLKGERSKVEQGGDDV